MEGTAAALRPVLQADHSHLPPDTHILQLLLGYLPHERRLWDKTLAQKRALYQQFCKVSHLNVKCMHSMPQGLASTICSTCSSQHQCDRAL